jgi:hypothetical protein
MLTQNAGAFVAKLPVHGAMLLCNLTIWLQYTMVLLLMEMMIGTCKHGGVTGSL